MFTALILFLGFTGIMAQKKGVTEVNVPDFPMADNKVVYAEVVEANGNAAELYNKAVNWFEAYYKNASSVIRSKEEGESVTGKGKFRIYDVSEKDGTRTPNNGMMMYDIKIETKEGRYRYEISNITQKASSYVGIEKWIDENKESQRFLTANYLEQTNQQINDVIGRLKVYMAKDHTPKSEEW